MHIELGEMGVVGVYLQWHWVHIGNQHINNENNCHRLYRLRLQIRHGPDIPLHLLVCLAKLSTGQSSDTMDIQEQRTLKYQASSKVMLAMSRHLYPRTGRWWSGAVLRRRGCRRWRRTIRWWSQWTWASWRRRRRRRRSAGRALALAVTAQVSRYCNSIFRHLAGQFWLGTFGWANVVAPLSIRLL
mgnify:CR=1 FL=1